ncbi:unnamed protein product [Closterium sp. Yama58-4]|nr:unnamed protein product [Closterium sp. Yama58-4]
MASRKNTRICEQEEEGVGKVAVEAEQGEEEERVEEEPSFITPPPEAEIRYADLSDVPADVWVRIANAAAEREECYCSWPLVLCAIAMPSVRRALSASSEPLYFEENCQCTPSAVSLAQQIRSFAWLTKQLQSPSQFNFTPTEAPPRLVSSLMRSCLFPSLSSITSFDFCFPQSLPSHPRLLFSLSQAPRLESLFIQHCDLADSESAAPNYQCNDPVMVAKIWEIISIMEEKNPDDTARLFPVLRRLCLSLSACSPLVLRFVACLSSQLHSLDLAADDQFVAQEGEEAAESGENARERDADGRMSFSLHLPLVTDVRLNGINCFISLSAPRLSSLAFHWQSRDSRLLLLPTCPAHLTSLFLRTDPICPWALHAPHLTSLHFLCTDMDPGQEACLPPGAIETVKVLEWRYPMDFQSLDLRDWHGLRCLHAVGWGPVPLSVFRSSELWPCDLEGMFFSGIGSEVVGFLERGLGGGDWGESLGARSHGLEGTLRDRGEVGLETGGCSTLAEEGSHADAGNGDADREKGRSLLARLVPGCQNLQRFEGWDDKECVLYVLDATQGLSRDVGGDSRDAAARRAVDNQPVTEIRYADLDALPADVWRRIANVVVERGDECYCSWPLVSCAIAMPCVRRALSEDAVLVFYETCQCPPPTIPLAQQMRSFAWLPKQHPRPSQLFISVDTSPPRLFCSLLRSCVFPYLSSLTSVNLDFSQRLPSPPRLLYSLSQAPRLHSISLDHAVERTDGVHEVVRRPCNDSVLVAEMWELISIMEERNPDDPDRPFPVLSRLELSLPTCSPLVLRFVSCLSGQLHYLYLSFSAGQFAAQEAEEGAESSTENMDGRESCALHLPLATNVSLIGIDCSVSISAPRLMDLGFHWKSRHSQLHLLPTCPAHLTFLFLFTDGTCPWAFHAPHLTSLDSLCTSMQPEQAACLPPGVIATVKALEWRNPIDSQSLDLSAWHGLRCLHAVHWAPLPLSVFRSGELWPSGLEGMFFTRIGSDVVGFLESGLEGDDGGEIQGTRSHGGEGTSRG